jgi:hypothetical protein
MDQRVADNAFYTPGEQKGGIFDADSVISDFSHFDCLVAVCGFDDCHSRQPSLIPLPNRVKSPKINIKKSLNFISI